MVNWGCAMTGNLFKSSSVKAVERALPDSLILASHVEKTARGITVVCGPAAMEALLGPVFGRWPNMAAQDAADELYILLKDTVSEPVHVMFEGKDGVGYCDANAIAVRALETAAAVAATTVPHDAGEPGAPLGRAEEPSPEVLFRVGIGFTSNLKQISVAFRDDFEEVDNDTKVQRLVRLVVLYWAKVMFDAGDEAASLQALDDMEQIAGWIYEASLEQSEDGGLHVDLFGPDVLLVPPSQASNDVVWVVELHRGPSSEIPYYVVSSSEQDVAGKFAFASVLFLVHSITFPGWHASNLLPLAIALKKMALAYRAAPEALDDLGHMVQIPNRAVDEAYE